MPQNCELPPPKNWQEFELLCWDLWRAIWRDPNTSQNGRQGQLQDGVDIFGRPNRGELWAGVQCKVRASSPNRRLTEADLREEIEKAKGFEPQLSEFILATTGAKDATLEQAARKITEEHTQQGLFSVNIFGWQDIVNRLADHPSVLKKYYPGIISESSWDVEAVQRAYLDSIHTNPLSRDIKRHPICDWFIEPKLILRGSPRNRSERADEVTLDYLLSETTKDVVIKAPCGFGKTTLLEHIMLRNAGGSKECPKCVPIYRHFRSTGGIRDWGDVVVHIARWLNAPPDIVALWLEHEEQKPVFLLDGLDQVSPEEDPCMAVNALKSHQVRLFVAGRPEAFENFPSDFSEYHVVEIMPFDRDRAERYCELTGLKANSEVYETVKQDLDATDGPQTFESPLMLNYARLIAKTGKGLTRATLFGDILEYYYHWEDTQTIMAKSPVRVRPSFEEIRRVWQDIAFEALAFMPAQRQHMSSKFINKAREIVTENEKNGVYGHRPFDGKLFDIAVSWGLFEHYRDIDSRGGISFLHQSLQEHLVACKLKDVFQEIFDRRASSRADSLDYYGRIKDIEITEEIGYMLAELLAAERKRVVCELQKWIEDDDNLVELADDNIQVRRSKGNILLFALMIRDMLVERCKGCRAYVQGCFDKERSSLLRGGRQKGKYWVRIPAGYFIRGDWRRDNSKPIRKVWLDEFFIGRYLVTDREFTKFQGVQRNHGEQVTTPNGFSSKHISAFLMIIRGYMHKVMELVLGRAFTFLCAIRSILRLIRTTVSFQGSSTGQSLKEPLIASEPAVFVSWPEALSYCVWLAKRIGKNVMLPTEAQWEKAARGVLGRIFPWGNDWSEDKCNTVEGGPGRVMNVITFRAGCSPYGCYDMAGNAREWCLDGYEKCSYDYKKPSKNPVGPLPWMDFADSSAECFTPNLRGGSWFNEKTTARCGNRFSYYPLEKDPDQGFRPVIVPGGIGRRRLQEIRQWCEAERARKRPSRYLYPHIHLSSARPDKSKTLVEQMNDALEPVQEFCKSDGGNVQVVMVKEETAYLELKGACKTCPMKRTTMKRAEGDLRRQFGQVRLRWTKPGRL